MLETLLPRARAFIPVRRLFLKIFFWFWLTTWGVLTVLALSTYSRGMHVVSQPNIYTTMAPILTAAAVRAYEAGGAAAFARFSQSNIDDQKQQLYLLDGFGREVLGRHVSKDGLRVARAVKSGQLLMFRSQIAAYRFTSPLGRPYVLLLFRTEGYGGLKEAFLDRGALFLSLLLFLVTSLCLWLAYHIALPIHAIQRAAREVSGGDLSARVSQRTVARHDELGSLSKDFNAMVARIEILVQTHKDLLAAVSHEVRSPLTRLSVSLDLLKQGKAEENEDLLQRMNRDISAIDKLIGQLLTLSRFETGISGTLREDVDLAQLVEQIGADGSFEGRGSDKSVQVMIKDAVCLPEADGYALHSACENIMRNAVRYTYPKTAIEVELTLDRSSPRWQAVIAVRDGGPGVPEELLQSIFHPFFRVQRKEASPAGNGLGLAIASGAVQMHHGSISARNRPGGGLEVLVRLPLNGGTPSAG